ncbi:MAG: hypothetical protein PHW10_01615 [Candidatus Peribacteraceae bacterium]|nr:hypothetical protein [Candidatus Peribacteraceae bacterium]
MHLRRIVVTAAVLFAPVSVFAARTDTWDFTGSKVPGSWDGRGWTSATPTEQGLHIITGDGGNMTRPTEWTEPVDAIRLVFGAREGVDGYFVWHRRDAGPTDFLQIPFRIDPGNPSVVTLDPASAGQWDPLADVIGISLPANTEVTLQEMSFSRPDAAEKITGAWKSFWMFDTFKNTSVNFLWGPVLRFSPTDAASLFGNGPPMGWSANRVFYAVLAAGGTLLFFLRGTLRRRFGARGPFLAFAVLSGALWIVYDLRMGAEFFSYALDDVRTYFSQPATARRFRSFDTFYADVALGKDLLQRDPAYAFLFPEGSPLPTRARYLTYPSIPITADEGVQESAKTWLVFRRPDVTVGNDNVLRQDGKELARGGGVVRRFDDTSFIYQIP